MTTLHQYFSTGQFKNIIKAVHDACRYRGEGAAHELPVLEFRGTVKLHGTNASVYNVLNNDTLVTQSKNNVTSLEEDHEGFAAHIHNNKLVVDALFTALKSQQADVVDTHTAVIYGEWCGGSIQKQVALTGLPKMFVVFGIKLTPNGETSEENAVWLKEDAIQGIFAAAGKDALKSANIYSIYDFPTYTVAIDFKAPQLMQNKLIDITLAVEKECPVGKAFGVTGTGEGVVWKCITDHPALGNEPLIFKVKGRDHSVSNVSTLAAVDTEKLESITKFIDYVVTENRLVQGVDYLLEQHLPLEPSSLPVFIKWMNTDCLKEERDVMVESNLAEKDVMKAIAMRSKQWFLKMISELDAAPRMKM